MRGSSYLAIIAVLLATIFLCAFVGCEQTGGGQTTDCNHASLTYHYATKATCARDGNIGYWTCNECGRYFADAECKSEITAQQTVVGAKGHNLNHVAALAPTCIKNGHTEHWQCISCGKYYADAEASVEITEEDTVIVATGHAFADGFCTVCGTKEPTQGLAYQMNSDGKSYSVIGIGTASDNDIVIADIYEGLPVTKIGSLAFYNTSIINISIPDSVTSIESSAFRNCSSLMSIVIPDSVTRIGDNAFNNCVGLTSIVIPNSVTTIEDYTFYGCTGLTSIVIPDSVTSIGNYVFDGCNSITKATMPSIAINSIIKYNLQKVIINGGESIGDWAFYNCIGLTSVTIPDSVTSIGSYAFYNCKGLTSVTIGNSVTSIGYSAFENCTGLTSVTIGNSVTSIGYRAFYNCTGLTSVTIGDSVTSIGYEAFYNCTGLTSIVIPDSVTSIGEYAFYYCNNLIIYCEATSKLSGWDSNWNYSNCPVLWGYKG